MVCAPRHAAASGFIAWKAAAFARRALFAASARVCACPPPRLAPPHPSSSSSSKRGLRGAPMGFISDPGASSSSPCPSSADASRASRRMSPRDMTDARSSSSSGNWRGAGWRAVSAAQLARRRMHAEARTMQRAPQHEKLRINMRKSKATESARAAGRAPRVSCGARGACACEGGTRCGGAHFEAEPTSRTRHPQRPQ